MLSTPTTRTTSRFVKGDKDRIDVVKVGPVEDLVVQMREMCRCIEFLENVYELHELELV